ncbi:DNA repair protein rhp26 [Lecanora helva]
MNKPETLFTCKSKITQFKNSAELVNDATYFNFKQDSDSLENDVSTTVTLGAQDIMDSSSKVQQSEDTAMSSRRTSEIIEEDRGRPQASLTRHDTLGEDEAARLKDLATEVRDQDDLERDIGRQADQLLTEQADERDQKRLEKTRDDREKLQNQVRKIQERLKQPTGTATATRLRVEVEHLEANIKTLNTDLEQIQERIDQRHQETTQDGEPGGGEPGNHRMPGESQREFLIRTGKITPFSKMPGRSLGRSDSSLQGVLLEAEEEEEETRANPPSDEPLPSKVLSHRNLVRPGFRDEEYSDASFDASDDVARPAKRRRLHAGKSQAEPPASTVSKSSIRPEATSGLSSEDDGDTYSPDQDERESSAEGGSVDESGEGEDDASFRNTTPPRRKSMKDRQRYGNETQKEDLTGLDDGNEKLYQKRLSKWVDRRSAKRVKVNKAQSALVGGGEGIKVEDPLEDDVREHYHEGMFEEEWYKPHPLEPDTAFEGGYKIPGDIYPSLFDYQKTGVQWLWELYSQHVGGIVGDEMGLGKTIQVISFLAGLHYSKKITKPIIVVAPATVMKQWVNEFHTWWPPFRVSILHTSGSGMIDVGRESRHEDELMSTLPSATNRKPLTSAQKSARRIVNRVAEEGHILVTTYSGLQTYADLLIPLQWEYAVLDEGHKIRNPNTAITIYCKELRTPNRIILSGTPMQNNLVELWSLFDYVFPMRLGTLVNFKQQFEFPIRQGGYTNASNLQVQTAMKCAETLKDAISPYLLQRFKADVASDLPKKSEQVLFCKLTKIQRETYEAFLASDDLKAIMSGKRQILYGVDILRKICNHPDLQEHKVLSNKVGYSYGSGNKSGKMQVVKALLELWKEQGHKTLLFAQHRIMLDILEKFMRSLEGFNYRRMDGTTPIHTRQGLVDEFNSNPNADVFLLTTKVGGLGINLTGADRVIIYDPDWNPSTDVQARERAWRLGQKREVMVYRLMTAGTIEEKIYHRQLFKQFLINKILRDPKQRQTFQMKDLHDLFTLGEANEPATETSQIFKGTEVRFDKEDAPVEQAKPNGQADESISISTTTNGSEHVRNLEGVASMERFYGEEEEERQKAATADATNSEARVMEGIFARSGVQAALEHDQIVNGKKVITADPQIIEQEAKKVAAAAARELKKAGEAARNVPVGTPTWTGEFGSAGKPPEQRSQQHRGGFGRGRSGPASSSILSNLQNRQAAHTNTSTSNNNTNSSSTAPRGIDFLKMIRDYLTTHGGQVHTQMLIDHFNRYCNTPAKTAEFKAMLTEIARLEKGSRGRGRWVLREEYRGTNGRP